MAIGALCTVGSVKDRKGSKIYGPAGSERLGLCPHFDTHKFKIMRTKNAALVKLVDLNLPRSQQVFFLGLG